MLTRKWVPSPNCSSGGHQARIICLHTSEGSTDQDGLAGYLANPDSEVSYHVVFDNADPGVVVECVAADFRAWAALDGNSWGVHGCCCTPSGAAYGWSRDEWMAHPVMLEKAAAWIAEEAARFGIPLVRITNPGSGTGVCDHGDVSNDDGGDHGDVGDGFPWDHVMALAGGTGVVQPAPPVGGGAAPPFPGVLLINYHVGDGTAQWQGRMAERGWAISVDDQYGPQSEDVCRSFQAEKGLAADGIVGPETWAAAWTAPVT